MSGATAALSAGRSASSRSIRRRRYSSAAASTPAAGTTTGIVFGVSRLKVPTASWSPPMIAPTLPVIVSQ